MASGSASSRSPAAALRALLVVLVLAGAGCGGDDGDDGGDPAAGRPAAAAPATAQDGASIARVPVLYDRLQPSVVAVLVRGARGAGEGSGVVFEPRRIVTNNHVVEGGEEVTVALASGERLPATIIARDERTDLAVLGVARDLPPAEFADRLPEVGSLAVAIGNPLGFESSVTAGVVSGLDRAIPSAGNTPALVNLLQTDAAISPGNSGGALIGADGEVIGINVAFIPPAARAVSIGFAIPAPTVIDVVEELIRDGEVEHAYLGAQLRPLTPATAEALGIDARGGAVVQALVEGGAAAGAGLRPGDVITEVGDRPVEQIEDVLSALRRMDPGERLELQVVRDGERRSITVELGRRPD
jgi:S1-C subfamily serine protease